MTDKCVVCGADATGKYLVSEVCDNEACHQFVLDVVNQTLKEAAEEAREGFNVTNYIL